ncbi:MAG: succinate dehydrogenase, cytochrome b556 subunit [Alphaproteobacteria bacterium]|nr:succinate dehydrogenase, cytochrome b556 subunit [Alphaproteobacteria bacterium]
MAAGNRTQNRPLSPFLQVAFKMLMTSGLSITHRLTGIALTVGILYFLWWLVAAAAGPEAYGAFMTFSGSPLGLLMLFGWTFCLYYHLANGIRHLFWDTGALLELKNAFAAGYAVLAFTAVMTLGTWFCVFFW